MSENFTFHLVEQKFNSLESKEAKEYLRKWNVDQFMCVRKFRYDQRLDLDKQSDLFVTEFFASDAARNSLQVVDTSNKTMVKIGEVKKVSFSLQRCTLTTVDIFDKLYEGDIGTKTGSIRQCLEDIYNGFTIGDELRKAVLVEDSENYHIFSEEDRSEVLFKLFRHILIGGSMCQYEDVFPPYLNFVKQMYKDFLSVQKNKNTEQLEIASHVFQITHTEGDGPQLFPKDSPNNICFLFVDPVLRHVTFYSSAYVPYW